MPGPLDGIRVIDLSAIVSGPLATCVLADQGADVIKVEPPGRGDLLRHLGSSRGGLSAMFSTLNRNKRSVALDVAKPRGREALLRLVAGADVFVQNFRPGVVDAMGLGEPALRRANPKLVYVSISGFGEQGPYAQRRVYDIVIQALSGMADSQADPRTGEPALVRNIVCDKATAWIASQAITAALLARERGAGGQHVRLSMLDASIAFLWPDAMEGHVYLGPGATPQSPVANYLSVRRTADGFMTVFAISDREFEGLCRALDRPDLARDARFAEAAARLRNADELAEIVEAATRARRTAELAERLAAEDVPHARVNRLAALFEDPQVVANELVVEMEHATAGRLRTTRPVARFDRTPAGLRRAAPILGEHGAEVLAEAGFAAAEIRALREEGVLG
jgi:crotonobetainyl-CoA:carnitine CoA-transferase CaiB-like acyl-CoA transferase